MCTSFHGQHGRLSRALVCPGTSRIPLLSAISFAPQNSNVARYTVSRSPTQVPSNSRSLQSPSHSSSGPPNILRILVDILIIYLGPCLYNTPSWRGCPPTREWRLLHLCTSNACCFPCFCLGLFPLHFMSSLSCSTTPIPLSAGSRTFSLLHSSYLVIHTSSTPQYSLRTRDFVLNLSLSLTTVVTMLSRRFAVVATSHCQLYLCSPSFDTALTGTTPFVDFLAVPVSVFKFISLSLSLQSSFTNLSFFASLLVSCRLWFVPCSSCFNHQLFVSIYLSFAVR